MYSFTVAHHRHSITDPQTGESLDVYFLLFELEFPVTVADAVDGLPIRDAYTIEVFVRPFSFDGIVIPIEFVCEQVSDQLFETGVQIEAAVRHAVENVNRLVVPEKRIWIAG